MAAAKGIETTLIEHLAKRPRMGQDQISVFANGEYHLAHDHLTWLKCEENLNLPRANTGFFKFSPFLGTIIVG